MFSIKHSIAEDYKYTCVEEVISQYSTYLGSAQIMQERRKIFDSAKYSIKRKHATMIYTAEDFFRLPEVLISIFSRYSIIRSLL